MKNKNKYDFKNTPQKYIDEGIRKRNKLIFGGAVIAVNLILVGIIALCLVFLLPKKDDDNAGGNLIDQGGSGGNGNLIDQGGGSGGHQQEQNYEWVGVFNNAPTNDDGTLEFGTFNEIVGVENGIDFFKGISHRKYPDVANIGKSYYTNATFKHRISKGKELLEFEFRWQDVPSKRNLFRYDIQLIDGEDFDNKYDIEDDGNIHDAHISYLLIDVETGNHFVISNHGEWSYPGASKASYWWDVYVDTNNN